MFMLKSLFSLAEDEGSKCQRIQRVEQSPLVVFFPTSVETNLGFCVQGPYCTTTNRENVPEHDKWNRYLAQETASLLVEKSPMASRSESPEYGRTTLLAT